MELISFRNVSFSFAGSDALQLSDLSFSVEKGSFVTLTGPSGSGKSTLLRLMKPSMALRGGISGRVLWKGEDIGALSQREEAARIGFVGQSPEKQIVTDKVWHELAFGPESLGLPQEIIRTKVAETASFFGMEDWYLKDTDSLSGGQKQILSLASVMVMEPEILLLDEPTSQLDPVAAASFLELLGRIRRELGVTVILAEQRLEEVFPYTDRVILLSEGRIVLDGGPEETAAFAGLPAPLKECFPVPVRLFHACGGEGPCPWSVEEGKAWFGRFAAGRDVRPLPVPELPAGDMVLSLTEVSFRYEKDAPDVLSGLSLSARAGEILAVLGGNGTGKSTLLSLIAGRLRPRRGRADIKGRCALLPQAAETLFLADSVKKELGTAAEALPSGEREERCAEAAELCGLKGMLSVHPYDLSGGEKQRLALACLLIADPDILLLDEPTKGMDGAFKRRLIRILRDLKNRGKLILLVSHDIEFCACCADRCGLLFAGSFPALQETRAFFSGRTVLTTAARRMTRDVLPDAVTEEDVLAALSLSGPQGPGDGGEKDGATSRRPLTEEERGRLREYGRRDEARRETGAGRLAILLVFLALIPLTLLWGQKVLAGRHYLLVSVLVVIEGMLPAFIGFERKRPKARELVLFAALVSIGAAGRALLFMLPEIKPVAAMTMIAAAGFGGEAGFLVGSMTMLVSNMIFSQGPFTPWQMFGMGLLGLVSGILYRHVKVVKKPAVYAAAGFFLTAFVYGTLMNVFTMLYMGLELSLPAFLSFEATGLPLDLLHGAATACFLLLGLEPFLKKFTRLQVRYGFRANGEIVKPS